MAYAPNEEHQFLIKTATEVLDTMSRLPGMSGEASGAVSADTQVMMRDAARVLKCSQDYSSFGKRHAQQFGLGYLEIVIRNIGIILTQWSHWNAICVDVAIPWRDCNGKEDWKKSWCKKVGRTYQECLYFSRRAQTVQSVYVDGKKWLHEKPAQSHVVKPEEHD